VGSVRAGILLNRLHHALTTTVRLGARGYGGLPSMHRPQPRRLLLRAEALSYLQLDDEQLQTLINTRQITSVRIAGVERFDLNDLDQLINEYKTTASRRP
jgi:hypothetical protein